ncbi:HK97 family major capsid protein [uncultured Mediterranean phage uvDeep-CGR0-KM15-C219]|nr:HK97 family major capsid protein [uncultured Mediterranean phage uvDeep-CGR0-KM15-C219]
MREQAAALLSVAETELEKGEVDSFNRMITEAQEKMEQADTFDQAATKMAALKGDFDRPLNPVPVTSNDVAIYDPTDNTARIKSDYKPASFIKGLPAMAQPLWVQEQMGDNVKDEARFMSDTFVKWFQSPSDDFFWKTASPDEAKAMQEDTDAEGGFFVPEQFLANTIHDTGVPGSQLRPICNVIRVASKDGYIPTMASATWAAIAEEAAPTESTPTVGQVTFSIEKSGGLIKVSRELLDDSAINLPNLLSQIFQEAAGQFEDTGIISGNNTTQYAGIMSDTNVAFYTMANATSVVVADLIGTFYALEAQHRANSTWVMKSAINSLINQIQVTGNGVTGIANITTAPSAFILGRPVVDTDVTSGLGGNITSTEKIAIFGDFKSYYIFDRVGFTIRRNDSLYMGNDQVGFFATRRGDGQVGLAAAFKIPRAA